MPPFLEDTFTDTNAVTLASHTPDTGGAGWTRHPSYVTSFATMSIHSNRVHSDSTTAISSEYYHTATPPSADYDVYGPLHIATNNAVSSIAVMGRMNTAADTAYWARYALSNGSFQLFKSVTGTATQLGSTVTVALVEGDEIRLRMVGTAISVLVNGTVIIGPVTDSAITAAGKAGIRTSGNANGTTGLHLDSITATDLTTPLNTVAPVVSGTRVIGETLTTTNGTWTNSPTSYPLYDWQRDNVTIGAANTTTYVLQAADVGNDVRCVVTAANAAGSGTPTPSNAVAVLAEATADNLEFHTAAAGGLGGSPGAEVTSPTQMWDPVTFPEAEAGDTEYRGGYMVWTHEVRSLTSTVLWINTQTTSPTTSLEIAVADEPAGTDLETIPDEQTPPVGPTFSAPATEGAGLSIGTLTPGQARGFWQKWIVAPGTDELSADACQLAWSGTPS